jgi:hypothetical protein
VKGLRYPLQGFPGMDIEFSRHARRRMALYGIQGQDVIDVVCRAREKDGARLGKRETVDIGLSSKYRYPLKVVFLEEPNKLVVISAYPLKKGRRS